MTEVTVRARVVASLAVALAAFAGCGGEERSARPSAQTTAARTTPAALAPPAVKRPSRPVTIAALGDSITAGAPLWDPRRSVREGIVEINPQSQYEFWARRRLGPRVRFLNCGVFGDTTDRIAARLSACTRGAQAVIVQGGVNDIARGRPVRAVAAELRAIVRRARRLGLRVALADVLPWNSGHPRFTPQVDRLNRLIAAIARKERVPLIPFHDAIEDPARPGLMRSDWTIDGSHPSVSGYKRLAEFVRVP